jgi:hypothetical protein
MAEPQTGGMIALIPESPGKLTVPGGYPPGEIHLTVAYLGDAVDQWDQKVTDEIMAVGARLSADFSPIEGRIMGYAVWNPDGGPDGKMQPCAVYELADDQLLSEMHEVTCNSARETIGTALWPQSWPVYKPHITAGEGIDTSGMKATGSVRFTSLRVALAGTVTDFPLVGTRRSGDPIVAHYDTEGIEAMAETTVDKAKAGEAEVIETGGELELHWPCLVLEGIRTGDGRFIPYGSLGARGLPLPVAGQVTNDEGHKGAEVFGKITKLERHEGPTVTSKETGEPFAEGTAVWEAWGVGDPESAPGKLAAKGYLTGNSADIADATVEDELADGKPTRSLVGGKIGGTTLVSIPAFADGFVEVNGQRLDAQPAVEPVAASAAWNLMDAQALVASVEDPPPVGWFTDPKLSRLTPLTRQGRHVFGHVADWKREHISFNGAPVYAAKSRADYKWFRTGSYPAVDADGTVRQVGVGRLTIGSDHAPSHLSHREAQRHHADESTAWAYVAAGGDGFGIWVNGVLKDDADELTVRKAFAHPPSIDQRVIDGHLELSAVHCVNTAGIPIPRARVASGEVVSMVAAGYVPPAPDNPDVLADAVAQRVLAGLIEHFAAPPVEPALQVRHEAAVLSLRAIELAGELGLSIGEDWRAGLTHLDAEDWASLEALTGYTVEELKTLRVPPYMKRIEKHLIGKGMSESHAIATAVNAAKKMCATGDLNFPGSQQVNPGSKAEACAAVAQWKKDRPGAT